MKLKSLNDFVVWNTSSRRISYRVIYSKITGSLPAGVLLSQICYWFLPDSGGENKLRVFREERYWIANRRKDWAEALGMTVRQYDTAVDILLELGVVDLNVYKFKFKENKAAKPTQHIALNYEKLLELLNVELAKTPTSVSNYITPKKTKKDIKTTKQQKYEEEIEKILCNKSKEYIEFYNGFIDTRTKKSKAGAMTAFARRNMLNDLEKYFPNNDEEHIRRFEFSANSNYDKVIFNNEKNLLKGNTEKLRRNVQRRDGIGKIL